VQLVAGIAALRGPALIAKLGKDSDDYMYLDRMWYPRINQSFF
jgi:hypothetical protein